MTQFVLLNRADHTVLNPNVQPGPVEADWVASILQSLDPSLELVAVHQPYDRPVVDERLILVTEVDAYLATPHPTYPQLMQWLITFTTAPQASADIISVLADIEANMNQTTIPSQMQLKYMAWMVYLLYQVTVVKRTLTPLETRAAALFIAQAAKIGQNAATKVAKIATLNAGGTPNLDSGWLQNSFSDLVS